MSRLTPTLLVFASLGAGLATAPLAGQTAPARPEVHVLATGGTISNAGPQRRTAQELVAGVPGLDSVARVTFEQFSNKASGSVTPDDWRAMAGRINELFRTRPALSGVVVTHGTDTMEETAFFLDLTVRGCRPVIVTGAMRRAVDVGADGPANLRNAVRTAAAPAARGRGALVLMNDHLFAARSVTKVNTSRMNAFAAPEAGPVGVADPDTVVFAVPGRPCDGTAPAADGAARFELAGLAALPRVDVIYSYVGADSVLVDAAVAAGARGIVIAGVGRGGMTPSQGAAIRRAAQRGVTVVVSSRTGSGRVPLGDGVDDSTAARLPIVGAEDLTPQKARVLLMLALAAGRDVRHEFARR
ncbi:MAG: asparaginase [Gemmatimonadaceae bacterium]